MFKDDMIRRKYFILLSVLMYKKIFLCINSSPVEDGLKGITLNPNPSPPRTTHLYCTTNIKRGVESLEARQGVDGVQDLRSLYGGLHVL